MKGAGNDGRGIQGITGCGFWRCGAWRPYRHIQTQDRQRAAFGKTQTAVFEKVGNPYLVRVGNMKVKVRFAEGGVSMEEAFENMLLSV